MTSVASPTTGEPIAPTEVPLLLLKNPSEPTDAYEAYFREQVVDVNPQDGDQHRDDDGDPDAEGRTVRAKCLKFSPHFLPVQEFVFNNENLEEVKHMVQRGAFEGSTSPASAPGAGPFSTLGAAIADESSQKGSQTRPNYGGLVFTSPRATSAFVSVLGKGPSASHLPSSLPIYSIGPGTTSILESHPSISFASIHGDHTGNGGALAEYIVDHYGALHATQSEGNGGPASSSATNAKAPPLLFLAGEQRRDILPRTLRSAGFTVDELVVYEAVMREGFERKLTDTLDKLCQRNGNTSPEGGRHDMWVVVFSPSGCRELLQYCGLLDGPIAGPQTPQRDDSGKTRSKPIRIATIGPTTRDFLIQNFGFAPDACAPKPSPEGIEAAIQGFLVRNG